MGEVNVSMASLSKIGYMSSPINDPIYKFSWKYKDNISYKACTSYKPDLMLRTLENYIGSQLMLKVVRGFYEQNKFRHVTTTDFIKFVEKTTNMDMSWFFSRLLFNTDLIDNAILEISNTSIENKNRVDLILSRTEAIKIPIEIRIFLEDGTKIEDVWNGEEKWIKKSYFTDVPAIGAIIDPNNKILLDVNLSNNSKITTIKWSPVLKWAGQWLFWMQAFLQIISSIC
jgi:hypothetical protein